MILRLINVLFAIGFIVFIYRVFFFWIFPTLIAHYRRFSASRRVYSEEIEKIQVEDGDDPKLHGTGREGNSAVAKDTTETNPGVGEKDPVQ